MSGEYRLGRLNGRWVVTWWEDGKRQRYRLKATVRADAEREAIDKIREKTAPPGVRTVEHLWEAYRQEKQGRRVASAMEFEWRAMKPHFGHLRADQISVDTCRSYVDKRRKAGKHDGTIWTELGHLRTVFRWAEESRLIDHAPKVERPPKPAPKDRYLTLEEIDRLLAVPMAHHIRLAILLMLSTASRIGAILELRWSRVDFERGQIDLRSSDIGPRKGRAVVPMNAGLRAALQTAKAGALTDYVIEWAGQPVASIKTGFNKATKAAKLAKVSPHVLRHTAAVHMVEGGISMDEVAQYLGHSNTSVTYRVYGRFSPTHLRKAASILDFTKTKEVS